jgi:hypothetical protein
MAREAGDGPEPSDERTTAVGQADVAADFMDVLTSVAGATGVPIFPSGGGLYTPDKEASIIRLEPFTVLEGYQIIVFPATDPRVFSFVDETGAALSGLANMPVATDHRAVSPTLQNLPATPIMFSRGIVISQPWGLLIPATGGDDYRIHVYFRRPSMMLASGFQALRPSED